MRLAAMATLIVLTLSACSYRSPEIAYGGDDEATQMFTFCAGSSPHTVQVRYGGPPRLISDSGSVVAPSGAQQACLDRVAERFPARSPEELAGAGAFLECLRRHGVEMPLQAITVDLATEPQQIVFSDVEIPDELLDAVDAAVSECRSAE